MARAASELTSEPFSPAELSVNFGFFKLVVEVVVVDDVIGLSDGAGNTLSFTEFDVADPRLFCARQRTKLSALSNEMVVFGSKLTHVTPPSPDI